MHLPFHIIQMLKDKSENGLRQPSDCEYLSYDIESKIGVHIGATTLKRLLGFAQDERTPHVTTLDAIARYLGYAHWDALMRVEDNGNSDFNQSAEVLQSSSLQSGDSVQITYLPDRKVTFEYKENSRYQVTESENSKLFVGDEVEIQGFVLHHPLLVSQVWRDGKALGSYTAGIVEGLSSITLLSI